MRIAIVDHSFHTKTRSTVFLHQLLAECGSVEPLWCDRWEGGAGVDIDGMIAEQLDCIVFCQQLYEPAELERLSRHSRIVLVPMFDQYAGWKTAAWRRYRPWPFVSFSRELHRRVVRAGCQSLPVRFFPDMPVETMGHPLTARPDGLHGIFWQREKRIDWSLVARVLARLPIARLHVRTLPDPGQQATAISAADRKRFNVVDLPWFDRPEDYLSLLAEIDFFIAPRKYEGIGMTFLEALTRGKIVIAADRATMNEYIAHGRNGFLFSTRFPRPLAHIGDAARLTSEITRWNQTFAADWAAGRQQIVELVRSGLVPPAVGPTPVGSSPLAAALRIFTG